MASRWLTGILVVVLVVHTLANDSSDQVFSLSNTDDAFTDTDVVAFLSRKPPHELAQLMQRVKSTTRKTLDPDFGLGESSWGMYGRGRGGGRFLATSGTFSLAPAANRGGVDEIELELELGEGLESRQSDPVCCKSKWC